MVILVYFNVVHCVPIHSYQSKISHILNNPTERFTTGICPTQREHVLVQATQ